MKIFLTYITCPFILSGCTGKIYTGNEISGFSRFPENTISVHQALKLAEPYLPLTFKLRSEGRNWPSPEERKPIVSVVLKGNFYYVVLENYPFKLAEDYMDNAVKVHKETGAVVKPH